MTTDHEDAIACELAPLEVLPSPNKQITPETVAVYVRILSDLTVDQVRRAVEAILHDPEVAYYPIPAVIRQRALPPRDFAVEAARVYKLVGDLERYDPNGGYWIEAEIRQHLGDAAAEAFVACGGGRALRRREDDTWTRKAFGESYALAARSAPPPVLPEPATLRALTRAPYKPLAAPSRVAGLIAGAVKHVTPPVKMRHPGAA